ncbi:hypothetical protein HanRHA438_Chr04g0166271 [Helianthus annuus]|nr:hypothetical protein HanRHA438_Chr04g0166271 [Helianthus annuus]
MHTCVCVVYMHICMCVYCTGERERERKYRLRAGRINIKESNVRVPCSSQEPLIWSYLKPVNLLYKNKVKPDIRR